MEMEIDPVHTTESRGRRPAVDLEESLPFVSRKKVKNPEPVLGWQLAKELKDLEEALSLAVRTERENAKLIEVVDGMGPLGIEEALSMGYRRKVEAPEEGKSVQEWQPEAELEEALSLAVWSRLMAEETKKFLRVAAWSNLMDHDVHSLAIKRGLKEEDAVSLANNFLAMYRIIFTALHAELLVSFDRVRFDPELSQWERFGRFVKERKEKGPEAPRFILFMIKASAKNAKVSWWRKEYGHFPPERQGYTAALRVARLVVGRGGSFCLAEAGEDGKPGALSHGVGSYSWPDPRVGVLRDGWLSPRNEVAVITRMPSGEGISVMSYMDGLGVKLGKFLFVLNMAWIVALSFTERSFYVSSKFTEETLYAVPGVDFVDITIPVENLIKKLYQMYEEEEREKQHTQDRQEMMCLQELGPRLEEEEMKRLEDEEMSQSKERPNEFVEETMKPVEENDLLKLGRGGITRSKRTEEPSPA